MNIGIIRAVNNLGMSFESVILIIVVLGSIIFFAKDFRIGAIILFIMSGGVWAWFYEAGMNYAPMMVVFFISLILMSLTIYGASKLQYSPGRGFV